MKLLSELKRRNVLRMVALYLVAAWFVMQVAEVVIGLANLPDWVGPAILTVLALGLPLALILSWFYELTPEGLALDRDIDSDMSATRRGRQRIDIVIIAVLCAAVILFAIDKWWPVDAAAASIAVLPFTNMSSDPEQEYFSDGISEEILNLLAQIRDLKVIARTSSFSYKNKDVDVATIASNLGVRHVLEGSVRRDGGRVRITAQLIDASDSSHIWSVVYDRDLTATSLFNLQTEIARSIATKLRASLSESEVQRLARVPTERTEAYVSYLLGRDRLRDRKVDSLASAVEQFARAIELDPAYAAAYAGLADACHLFEEYTRGDLHKHCPPRTGDNYSLDLEPLVRKALELDDSLGEAWIAYAAIISASDWGTERALWPSIEVKWKTILGVDVGASHADRVKAAFERGLELSPSFVQGYLWYAAYLHRIEAYPTLDDWYAAWERGAWQNLIKRALEIDPLSVTIHRQLSNYPRWADSIDSAFSHARRITEIAPDSPLGYDALALNTWVFEGRIDTAIELWHTALARDPGQPEYLMQIAKSYRALGDFDKALDYLSYVEANGGPGLEDLVILHKANVLAFAGRDDEAAAMLAPLVEKGDQRAQMAVTEIDIRRGNLERALDQSRRDSPGCYGEGASTAGTSNVLTIPLTESDDNDCFDDILIIARIAHGTEYEAIPSRRLKEVWEFAQKTWLRYWAKDDYAGFGIADVQFLALLGRTDEALASLEAHVQRGWKGAPDRPWRNVYVDPRLDFIRGSPRFAAAVSVIESAMAEQLENVRDMERRGEIPTLDTIIGR